MHEPQPLSHSADMCATRLVLWNSSQSNHFNEVVFLLLSFISFIKWKKSPNKSLPIVYDDLGLSFLLIRKYEKKILISQLSTISDNSDTCKIFRGAVKASIHKSCNNWEKICWIRFLACKTFVKCFTFYGYFYFTSNLHALNVLIFCIQN